MPGGRSRSARRVRLGPLVLACAVSFCAAAGRAPVEPLVARLESLRQVHQVPAVGFTLVDRERVLYSGAFGIADVASDRPATGETLFRIGSVTKAFTALAVLLLSEDGRLDLDDPVAGLAADPPFSNRWEATHPVLVVQLLEHTAGFADLSREEFDFNEPVSLAAALALRPESRRTRWPPGLHVSYSNSGAGVATWLLEQLTDRGYEEFVAERLFAPLGMESAGYVLDERTRPALARGYEADGRSVIPYWHMLYRAFGGINLAPRDMAPFLQLLLNRGRHGDRQLLAIASIERMERPATSLAARDGLGYGHGLGSYHWLHDGFLFHGHGGDADGYLAHFGYSREAGLGYFLVINEFDHEPACDAKVSRSPHCGRPHSAARTGDRPAAGGTAGCARYVAVTQRFPETSVSGQQLSVEAGEDRLYTRLGEGPRRPLLPVNARHFRRPGQPLATAAFVSDQTGMLYLQGELGSWQRVETVD